MDKGKLFDFLDYVQSMLGDLVQEEMKSKYYYDFFRGMAAMAALLEDRIFAGDFDNSQYIDREKLLDFMYRHADEFVAGRCFLQYQALIKMILDGSFDCEEVAL